MVVTKDEDQDEGNDDKKDKTEKDVEDGVYKDDDQE